MGAPRMLMPGSATRNQLTAIFTKMCIRDSCKLAAVELVVVAAAGEQLAVRALLDDPAVAHDEDEVGAADGGEPVGDEEAGPVPELSLIHI